MHVVVDLGHIPYFGSTLLDWMVQMWRRAQAKGGSLAVTRALSGYLTTASGRHVVFSVIVNGPRLGAADDAIDEFVTNLASLVT